MAAADQTLFSFDLFVECVQFDGTRKMEKNIVDLAVAVRLLDFPTLLIHRSENAKQEESSSESDPDKRLSSSDPLLPSEGRIVTYSFNKGKSCLFKMNLDSLHSHLSNTPLYIMVLDVRNDIPKLMGSLLISLAKLTGSIKLSVDKHGIWAPAAFGEKIINPLLNLMGEKIGTIYLVCKVVSLGATLIPHITEKKVYEVGAFCPKPNVTQSTRSKEDLNNSTYKIQPPSFENFTTNICSRSVCVEEQHNEVLLSDSSETKRVHVASASTQTQHVRKKDRSLVAEVAFKEQWSMFCPPPLFYSSGKKTARQHSERYMVDAAMKNIRMVSLNTEDSDNDEESAEMEGVYQKREPRGNVQDRLFSSSVSQPCQTVPTVTGDGIRQLPLLNALLFELSHFSGQLQQQPFSVHPNLASLYISTQDHSPKPASGKTFKTEILKQNASPVQRNYSFISLNKDLVFGKNNQERSHPKRKLKYGLTQSFRLRLKQIKPGMTKQHKCMEEVKTKQNEPQRKSSVKPKQTQLSASQKFCRSFDECAEMLNSFENDSILPELKSRPQKKISCGEKPTMQSKSLSRSLMAGGFHDKVENKEVQVCVPTILSQDFDHNACDSVSNKQRNPSYLIQTSPHLQSDDRDGGPSRISHRSDYSHASQGPDEYLDDFTSLDPTDGSPDPLSSPEPYRPQRRQVSSSNSSSDSHSHENKPHPVPLKAQTSPKRSLRSTHKIKPHLQNSLHITSSEESRCSSSNSFQQRNSHSSLSKSLTCSGKSLQSDHASQGNVTKQEQSLDKFQVSNNYLLETVSSLESEEGRDNLASLGFQNKYQPISELVINKLPGYTL